MKIPIIISTVIVIILVLVSNIGNSLVVNLNLRLNGKI